MFFFCDSQYEYLFLQLNAIIVIIKTESDRGLAGSGLSKAQIKLGAEMHRIRCMVHFAPLSALTYVGELFVYKIHLAGRQTESFSLI